MELKISLTENFELGEFACKCCGMLKYNPRMALLLEDLEKLRKYTGPLTIVSGYRCPKNNTRAGGAIDSQHLQALAADLSAKGITPQQLAVLVKKYCRNITGIGVGQTKFHVDVKPGPRREWTY